MNQRTCRRAVQLFVFPLVVWFFLCCWTSASSSTSPPAPPQQHQSNHAVIVSSSRYWFNYRHAANALSIYQLLRDYGVPDNNIVMLLADEYAVSPRNPAKNGIYNTSPGQQQQQPQHPSLHTDDTKVDYRGEDVTVENFIRVLTGRGGPENLPVLHSDENSNVLVYLTGHGGDRFFKFQDVEEITADQLAETLNQMYIGKKYKELLLVADTCQAFTLGDAIVKRRIPNVSVIGSSLRDQSSYAHSSDRTLGLSVIEKWTHFFVDHVRNNPNIDVMREQTVYQAMIEPFSKAKLGANIGWSDENSIRKLNNTPLRDFFANVQNWSTERDKDNNNDAENDVPAIVEVQLLSESSVVRLTSNTAKSERRRMDKDSKQQCTVSDGSSGQCTAPAAASINTTTTEHLLQPMEPGDSRFLLLAFGLIAAVVVTSQLW